jgi:MYXO-CTERM domain-containing protein
MPMGDGGVGLDAGGLPTDGAIVGDATIAADGGAGAGDGGGGGGDGGCSCRAANTKTNGSLVAIMILLLAAFYARRKA